MNCAIIIPARYASTRLPGKPLLAQSGKPLIRHAYEQASKASCARRVIVATDDERIFKCVEGFGGEVMMTSHDHTSGTARVAQVAETLSEDMIINLQGDEPEINPDHIDGLADAFRSHGGFAATLAAPFPASARKGAGSPLDPSAVKVVLGAAHRPDCYDARLFTRALHPFPLDGDGACIAPERYFLHVGIYAFSRATLHQFARWQATPLERSERLEQLRILENGERIVVKLIDAAAPGIDTPSDYEAFLQRCENARDA